MPKPAPAAKRREESLSRDQIIAAAIDLLDRHGEIGLTFRALADRLTTGAGAIYWHVANKNALVASACDTILAGTMEACARASSPRKVIRGIALAVFDAIERHPWLGSALIRAELHSPLVRIFEPIGQQVRALGVPPKAQREAVSALLGFILGVGGQNAANRLFARSQGINRAKFLADVSAAWSRLDPNQFPFAHSMAKDLPFHDDRRDFQAGIDLILKGIGP